MTRREFLMLLAGSMLYACGGGGGTVLRDPESLSPQPLPCIAFGLGDDPYALFTNYRNYLDELNIKILNAWINGAKDERGRVYTPDRDWLIWWYESGFLKELDRNGYSLMFITWENYDFQNPQLGAQATKGDYHISDTFIEDVTLLKEILNAVQLKNKCYIALATEYTTYPACRYTPECTQSNMTVNAVTLEYFEQLRSNLSLAIDILSGLNNVEVGISSGGWMVDYDRGSLEFFDVLFRKGNAIFFQVMETTQNLNPKFIKDNVMYFKQYKKPMHVAHYMPVNEDKRIIISDAQSLTRQFFVEMQAQGLASFSFMRYKLLQDPDVFNSFKHITQEGGECKLKNLEKLL